MASHPVGHSVDTARTGAGRVLLQLVTLAFRTGAAVSSSTQKNNGTGPLRLSKRGRAGT